MREIRIKLWCKERKSWVGIDKIYFGESAELCCVETDDKELYFPDEKNFKLVNYTGLKDKNGVQIFEGDILKLDIWQGQEDNYVDSVTHDVVTGRPSKYIKKLGELKKDAFGGLYVNDFYLLNLEIADNYEIEVIGNIYQNNDLLEG